MAIAAELAWVLRNALSIAKSWMMPPKRTAVTGTPAARCSVEAMRNGEACEACQ